MGCGESKIWELRLPELIENVKEYDAWIRIIFVK